MVSLGVVTSDVMLKFNLLAILSVFSANAAKQENYQKTAPNPQEKKQKGYKYVAMITKQVDQRFLGIL